MGVEPTSPAWKAGVIAVIRRSRYKIRRFSRHFKKVTLVPLRLLLTGGTVAPECAPSRYDGRDQNASLFATCPKANPMDEGDLIVWRSSCQVVDKP
ncbi:hypothetical protein SPIRO4BDMA_70195 [uncultured spirochete]|uniref:Uncharacterized protein n=1 Tax=uncultured spirochete TaxID=156406 RepID=A0A3P3XUX7_9SPIR|nr:hypothetical protein SPIRO4BDMA_70195 [uncultured spirochete]